MTTRARNVADASRSILFTSLVLSTAATTRAGTARLSRRKF